MKRQAIHPTKTGRDSISGIGLFLIGAMILGLSAVQAAQAPLVLLSAAPHYTTLDIKTYQFRATTSSGAAISDGMHTVVFSIWDDSSGGTSLWNETQLVTTTDGLGSAQIGSLAPIPLDILTLDQNDSTSARFLQIEIDTEIILPRTRLVATPYANAAERLIGDVLTQPGELSVVSENQSPDGPNVILHNESESPEFAGIKLEGKTTVDVPVATTAEMNVGHENGHILLSNTAANGIDGMLVDLEVTRDISGDPEARLSFFGTDATRASKPREIVVVGSKVKEVVRYYENPTADEVATRDHVSGRAFGRRTYPPFRVTGAVLPDSVPAYDLAVDSSGGELFMAKNNTNGSSCWVRVAQNSSGSSMSLSSTNGSSSTETVDAHDYLLWQRNSHGHSSSGDSSLVSESINVDSSYTREIVQISGTSAKKATHSKALKALKDLVQGHVYTDSLFLTDGSSTTTTVDGYDYLRWQRNFGSTNSAGDVASLTKSIGADSGFSQSIAVSDASGNSASSLLEARKGANETAAISSLRTLVSSQSLFHETKLDSNGASCIFGTTDGPDTATSALTALGAALTSTFASVSDTFNSSSSNSVDETGSNLSMHYASSSGTSSDFDVNNSPTGTDLVLSNIGSSGLDGVSMHSESGESSMKFYKVLPSRAIVDKIALEQTSASSKLYVGNLGFGSNDGVNIISDFSGGARIGIGTNSPGVALHVIGNICYTGGITSCSDGRYKEDIETIDNALDLVEHLRGVEYKWKKDEYPDMRFSDGQQLGLVAQEVKEVLPELVSEDADGYYSVDYVKLTPILIEAIKEQQNTIEELKKRVADKDQLKVRLEKLERLVGAIVEKN